MQKHLNILIIIVATLITVSIISENANAGTTKPAPAHYQRLAKQTTPPRKGTKARTAWIICKVFGRKHCTEALDVAWCESEYVLHAQNKQYQGLFQLGTNERKQWGRGHGAWRQAQAAKKYFNYNKQHYGDGWIAWSCKPRA